MIFKLSLKEIIKNKTYNLFNILQLTLVLILIVFLISSLMSTLKYYLPMKDILTSKGFMANISMNDFGETVINDRLYSFSDKIDKIYSTGQEFFEIKNSENQSEPGNILTAITLDKFIVNTHKPLMKSGKWLSDTSASNKNNEFYAVIVKNNLGYTTGSVINTTATDKSGNEKPVTVKIVGEIEDGEKLFYQSGSAVAADVRLRTDFEAIESQYYPYNSSDEEIPYLFIIKNELDEKNYETLTFGTSFITFDSDTTKEELSEAEKKLSEYGELYNLETVNRKSLQEAKNQAFTVIPMIVSILIFLAISSICLSAINTKKQLRNYGIYYTCGSRWKQCALISVCSAFITSLFAVIIAAAGMFSAEYLGLLKATVITFGKWQLRACLSVIVFNIFVSLIMPFTIIGRTSPREIIKSDE